ncbi:MAG: four helix bundle protein [Gemmatimonadetes bacterium]|uniref:Four helix bundle protein n=1 Tax=Candidatus Kutchimonas denitrificans TaxID=3056748 RepID=A0AAE4ZAA8_9BACT|nr:four helix bundle protein [Gemmatimonadota bacterium]NIR75021.1 four helix bundle protein [Candidatus Kutchimonas denitrificans]NIS01604.1 four helix bundle protein [Gemmatimonadota bacterium]NIT67342.1 four helix bundle protein [Gemmatimonadota bacterium]NIU52705.1 four helix bundle protein [Gemmatimonadota bacterium]
MFNGRFSSGILQCSHSIFHFQLVERVYDLEDRLVEFAVVVSGLADRLPRTALGRHVAGQLIRCSTAAAPNYGEACNAESQRDFIHKMRVCLKELRETLVWLKFTKRKVYLRGNELDEVVRESDQLVRIFAASVRTAERNRDL